MPRLILILVIALLLVGCKEKAPEEAPEAPPATATQTNQAPPEEAPTAEAEPEELDGTQWVESTTYDVKFRVPDDWEVKTAGDSISVTSPDGTITTLLVGTESEGLLQAALESIKKEVSFKDVNLKKDSQTVLNGLPGYAAQGAAVLVTDEGDQEIEFLMNSVRTGEKGVAMMVFAEAEMYEAKREEVEGISKTLQKR